MNDFPEIVPTREITNKLEKIFFFSSVAVGLFLKWEHNATASNSTHINPARVCVCVCVCVCVYVCVCGTDV